MMIIFSQQQWSNVPKCGINQWQMVSQISQQSVHYRPVLLVIENMTESTRWDDIKIKAERDTESRRCPLMNEAT